MVYRINHENIKSKKVLAKHGTGTTIKLFPYNTKFEPNRHKESVNNFKSIVGEFSRIISRKKIEDLEINDQWISNCINNVDIEDDNQIILKDIIKCLFFNNKELDLFHPIVFNYIKKDITNINQEIAIFLFDVLLGSCDDDLQKLIYENYECKSQNILANLVIRELPTLSESVKHKINYKGYIPCISTLFQEDFKFMLKNQQFFLNNFDKVLKFYYFQYVAQLSIKLNRFFSMNSTQLEPIYFNLEWESVSKSRSSYHQGKEKLFNNIKNIFSHAYCLELLNHNYINQKFSYQEIANLTLSMDEREKNELVNDIKQLKIDYKSAKSDVDFTNQIITRGFSDEIENEVYELFCIIDYQFNKSSSRKKPYNDYVKWFEEFCNINFLKQRGPLGKTLNISEEYLIFITKLCIKDRERLRIKILFGEYEKRGLFFDRDSQNKIVELFEKLNLIDKKSDSGDAQYVKAIL